MRSGDGGIRPPYQAFAGWLERTPAARIAQKREEAERAFHRVGITFAVYGEESGGERLIPFVSAVVKSVDLARRELVVDWGADF